MNGLAIEHLLLIASIFLLLGIIASKAAARSGVPALLLFLGLGMIAGSDGLGIPFDSPSIAQGIGTVALAYILFSGGLDTQWREIKPVLRQGLILATVGVTLTALLVGVFAWGVLGFTLAEGILLGAIISSTDAAAVFAILRGRGVNLRGRLKPLLELESGSNDPMAIFLTIGMIQLVADPTLPVTSLIPLFMLQMGVGAVVGLFSGRLIVAAVNRLRLDYDGLYPVLTIALVMLIYGAAAAVGGSGFLAVYLAGLVMGQKDFIHRRSLLDFHDGLAWLMQIVMFVTLGLLVFPSQLPAVAGAGLAVALFLIFVARPVSVWIGLYFSRMTLREKHFVAWVGLRGAAPIVLATFPLVAGLDQANTIFNLVFFIVLMSVLLQGTLIVPVARLLKVYGTRVPQPVSPLSEVLRDGTLTNELIEITVPAASPAVGQRLLDLKLPPGALVVLIGRDDDVMVPNGSTEIHANDHVLILAASDVRDAVCSQLEQAVGYPRMLGAAS